MAYISASSVQSIWCELQMVLPGRMKIENAVSGPSPFSGTHSKSTVQMGYKLRSVLDNRRTGCEFPNSRLCSCESQNNGPCLHRFNL